ncbi:MAG: CvpA family protein [Hyphomicrobiales bacterium]|nr:CvpA family protein [Hyphomicrobiales bacterium]MDE2116134.1 CvpA family protein [Hyphomicrobiales bacterium]
MPSYLDLGLIVVVLVSALLSMVRGFTREVLAIASWGVAAMAAYMFYPRLVPILTPYVHKPVFAIAGAVAIVFLVTLILVSLLTVRISDAILDSKIGALDRSLGFVFGAARGLLLCVVAFVFFTFLMQDKTLPSWAADAKAKPLLEGLGTQLEDMLPGDAASSLYKMLDHSKAAKDLGVPLDTISPPATTTPTTNPPAPNPPPTDKN